MKATLYSMGLTAAALGLTLISSLARADDAKPANLDAVFKAVAEAGKPGPDHAKLQPLVGNWTYTCRCWMDPTKPPIETRGTIERRWILGGRFLEEKIAGTGFDGKPGFEGVGLVGYDNGQKRYTVTFACSMSTGTSTGVGVAETSGRFTFQTTCSCPLSKDPVKGRDEIRIENGDRVVTESFKFEEGKETKVMEIVAVRKK